MFVHRAGEREDEIPAAMPGGSAWVEQQVPGDHFVQLDWAGKLRGQLPRIAWADDAFSGALNDQRGRRSVTSAQAWDAEASQSSALTAAS